MSGAPKRDAVGRIANPDSQFIEVAVLVERRPAVTKWSDWIWQPVEVLADAPDVPPWTLLRQEPDGRALFLAGRAEIALHPTDTANYKHTIESPQPSVWVVLRAVSGDPGLALQCVTVDAGEAHIYADVGNDIVEALPLPPFLAEATAAFVARHHRERGFWKRRRDQADPEALGRRPAVEDEE